MHKWDRVTMADITHEVKQVLILPCGERFTIVIGVLHVLDTDRLPVPVDVVVKWAVSYGTAVAPCAIRF